MCLKILDMLIQHNIMQCLVLDEIFQQKRRRKDVFSRNFDFIGAGQCRCNDAIIYDIEWQCMVVLSYMVVLMVIVIILVVGRRDGSAGMVLLMGVVVALVMVVMMLVVVPLLLLLLRVMMR